MHDYKIRETEQYLVQDGKTEYKILIPEGMEENDFIHFAVEDLKRFFAEATGLELEVVSDAAMEEGGKYLAIHSTKLASAESVGATYEVLGKGGFCIKTVGDCVVMCGATAEASMYAVYAFLELALGFKYYYTEFYKLDKNVKNLKLMSYEVTDVPDFQWRIQSCGWIRYNDANRKRMRWTDEKAWIIPADPENDKKTVWHNTFVYLPKEKYLADYPEFYSHPLQTQLCYTARGDNQKREIMVDIVAKRVCELFAMEQYKDYRHISVSIQDNQECCTCPTCLAEKAKYGADSAVMVKFLNDVAKRVSAWMETEEGKPHARDFRIMFFAYHATNDAPARYNEQTGNYEPIDGLVCDPHVVVYFAETNGDYMANFHDEGTANTKIGKNMKGWGVLSREIYFWSYSTNFCYFLTPYNSFDTVQDILRFAKKERALFAMIQDQWIQEGTPTGFDVFKQWLHSKLEWDVEADVTALTDEFFDAYFMEASATMRQVYEEWKVLARHQWKDLGYSGYRSVYIDALQKEFWPKEKLEHWIALTEKAKEDVAVHKAEDPALYQELVDHIAIESIAFRYILIWIYGEEYPEAELLALKKVCAADLKTSGLTLAATARRTETHVTQVQDLLERWGVKP